MIFTIVKNKIFLKYNEFFKVRKYEYYPKEYFLKIAIIHLLVFTICLSAEQLFLPFTKIDLRGDLSPPEAIV